MYCTLIDTIELDREQRKVRKDGEEIHLTGLEYGLIDYLSSHVNRICTRQELLDHIWGSRFQYDTGTIDVHLNALRRKLGWSRNRPIETIRGVGLIFRVEQNVTQYTIDLQSFFSNWLLSHSVELSSAGVVPQLHLTPFVNEITMAPKALQQLLDGVLGALLPTAKPGILCLHSKLTMHSFILSLDLNGTVNELRIPIYGGSDNS